MESSHGDLKVLRSWTTQVCPTHAVHLDQLNDNTLWKEVTDKELKSLKDFKTFWTLDEGFL